MRPIAALIRHNGVCYELAWLDKKQNQHQLYFEYLDNARTKFKEMTGETYKLKDVIKEKK